jgi:hypothetical protein
LYIIDLPKIISDSSKPFVFVDDTSIIITNSDPSKFKKNVFIKINSWLKSNLLSLKFDKTHFLLFIIKNSQEIDMLILHKINKLIMLIVLNFSD